MSETRRILWVLNGCGLEGTGLTGAPVRFHEISRRWAEMGLEQHVLTTSGGETMLRGLGCTLPMTIVPASLLLRREPCRAFRLWSYVVTACLARLWYGRLPKADAVIAVSDYFCDVIPARDLARRFGARWIQWIHHCETPPAERPGNRLVNTLTYAIQAWSFRRTAAGAASAWVNDTLAGDEIERRLRAVGMDMARLRRMRNGLDAGFIRRVAEPTAKRYDAVMVGVRPNKGLYDIVPIWRRVNELRPNTRLLLMGGMSGEQETLAEIRRLNLPIDVLRPEGGFLPAAAYVAALKGARVLFAPSHEEGWGIAVGEAICAGLKVVAYDLPAYRQIYAGAYVAVPCFETEAFAQRLVAVLEGRAGGELAEAAAGICARYDWQTLAQEDCAALLLR